MRLVMWILRLLLFFLLFGFAVKNDHLVRLHFFFGAEWELPLVFVILAVFTAGAVLGTTATFGSLLRQRREIGRLRRQAARAERDRPAVPAKVDEQAPEAF
ncbi:LapA family protein [Pseudothauera rhizosphaerae]|uniref:LapA family protein n=1 Tax=Pseudothauera rhizosphaerae TaxID=2565932 RepID=A0A4S4AW32_9RHOO|nr:LapA family protein [Pseudothauera rhizosphaerae]THF64234.1 LapA family protein [Pseudothauera rhizosphaerae]